MIPRQDETFVELSATPERMDALWAAGWRHFGPLFFRYSKVESDGAELTVMPLRIVLERFAPSQSQRRVLRRNADLEVRTQAPVIDAERRRLFDAHKERFKENMPDALENFLGPAPAVFPCHTIELAAYSNRRLVAASYFDVGREAASSVYAMFDPAESRRSPGIATMLWEIEHARRHGCRFLYTGYCYRERSVYDYKKQFAATEWFDWRGHWRPMKRAAARKSP